MGDFYTYRVLLKFYMGDFYINVTDTVMLGFGVRMKFVGSSPINMSMIF